MSTVSEKFNKTMTNQMYVNSLADDGVICNYTRKTYDEQQTYKGGEGPRQIFQNLNKKVKLYHKFLKYLSGEERADLNEAIPVIDYFNPDNSSFLYTYPVYNDQVDSTEIIRTPEENVINYAMAGEPAAEYFYNTRSSVTSQLNIQAGYINETGWIYNGLITTYNIINGQPQYNTRALPIQFYACDEADEVQIGLDYMAYRDFVNDLEDNPHGKKVLLVPFNDDSNKFNIEDTTLEGGLQRFRGISSQSKSSSVLMLTAPAYYYGLPVTSGYTANSLGSAPQDYTWNSITLSSGDFVLLLPGDYTDFSIKSRILIFKRLDIPNDNDIVVKFPVDWGRTEDSAVYPDRPVQEIKGKDKFMIGPYLVFMAYLHDIQADIPWETLEPGQVVPEVVKDLLDQSPYLFDDILHFERALFGPSSGIMNGLFSVPYEYDRTVADSQAQINFGGDELKFPRVIKWLYNNDVDLASFRGMTIAPGTRYFPGHLLNRGTILASPLKRSSKDPVAKLLYDGSIIAFKYSDGLYKSPAVRNSQYNPDGLVKELYMYQDPSNPENWIPLPEDQPVPATIKLNPTVSTDPKYQEISYLGKSEIIHDMLNSFDLSLALYSKFAPFFSTSSRPSHTYLTFQGLTTFDDFPKSINDTIHNMLYPKRLFISSGKAKRGVTTVSGLSHQIEALKDQLQSGQILSSSQTSVTALAEQSSVTYLTRYTAEDIKVYIDSFFDCLRDDLDNGRGKKKVCLDYRNPKDLGLYESYEEYSEYQRFTGDFTTEWYKGKKKVQEGTKGASPKLTPVSETIAAVKNYLQYDKPTDLALNGSKSFHLYYHHQYISSGAGEAPVKPAVYMINPSGQKIETVYVNGIEYDQDGKEVDEDESAITYGLEPILRVITPMDTFLKKRAPGAPKPQQLLVYPASKTVFPESLFLFSTTNLEALTGKPGAPTILYDNKAVPVIFYHAQSGKFLFLQAVHAWHYNYNDIEKIEFYTPETADFKLSRKNPILWYQQRLDRLEDQLWDEEHRYRHRTQFDNLTFNYQRYDREETDDEGNTSTRSITVFTITNPTSASNSWKLEFDSDSAEYKLLKQLLDYGELALRDVQGFLRNWQLIATVDPEDLGSLLESDSEFAELLQDVLDWALWKQEVTDLTREIEYYQGRLDSIKNTLKGEAYKDTDFIQEFYCYQLQPVPLTLDLDKSITLYKQETSGVDSVSQNNLMEFSGLGDLLQLDVGPLSSDESYFKIGAWNPEVRGYDRPLESTDTLNGDLAKLGTSEIIFRIPDLQAHTAAWYKNYSTDSFFKAFGTFIDDSLKSPSSPLRQATNRLTQNILSQFQLSVLNSGAMQTPLLLTELPQILAALQALKGPLSALALTGTKVPLSGLATQSYSPDSIADLGDLTQLILRYDNDLEYTALDPFPEESKYVIPFDWTDLTFESLGNNRYQYTYQQGTKVLGQVQTTLAGLEGVDPFQEVRVICQSESLAANHINLAAGVNWIKTEAELEIPTPDYDRLVKNINKLLHCVFKAWIIPQLTLKVTDAVTRGTKVQRSFKYLEQNFGQALTDASTQGFTKDLCRKLDEQFGDNTRPFLNMEKTSCSLPVDPTVEALKQTYINRVGTASQALISSLQAAASDIDTQELDSLWDQYFLSPATDWRSDLYTVSIDKLTSTFKVNFSSQAVQTLINKLLKVGYSTARYNHITYTPQQALKALITEVRALDFTSARDEDGYLILPETLGEYTTDNHIDQEKEPYFQFAATQTLAAYFTAWQEVGVMPEAVKTLIESFNITTGEGTASKDALLENITELYNILRTLAIPATYNDIIIEGNKVPELTSTALTEYLARETFSTPNTFEFYEEMNLNDEKTEEVYLKSSLGNYQGPVFKLEDEEYSLITADDTGIPVYAYNQTLGEYVQIRESLTASEPRYKKRWGWYEPSATGANLNNFYFLPVYCEDTQSQSRVSPAKKTKYNAVYHNYFAITLNLHLPEFQYDTEEKKYILKAPDLDLTGIDTDQDLDPDRKLPEDHILPTYSQPADESAIFQATLPVPNGSNADVSEVLLKAIADLAHQALMGSTQDSGSTDVAVRMLEEFTEPEGLPETLYYKRYEALNNRLNRITGTLYSAARALQGKKQLDKVAKTEDTSLSVYSNLMTVVPIAQFDELTYMASQEATASTIPLDGRFYYNAEMEALRNQISDKCVLTCHSCPVKENCPFYNEEEILKYFCPPAGWLSFYFKDNKLDLLYYDDNPKYLSPDIYEYEETPTGKTQVGESIPAEYFKALHKPYSEVLRKTEIDKDDWIAPVRPLRKGSNSESEDSQVYSLMPLEEELKQSPQLNWNETVDGDISWLTNARYGTIEVNNNAERLNSQYQELDLRPYTYLHNAVYVFDEETEFDYQASPDFYNIDNLYLTDTMGMEHRYGGRTRIMLPTTLKAFVNANPGDDVYLVSDDTMDSNRTPLTPIIYLDTIENLRKAGRTAFNLNTNAAEGIEQMSDKTQYASDIARWSVAICKNHNANWPADPTAALSQKSHHSLAENQDQYWMEELTKKVYVDPKKFTGWVAGEDIINGQHRPYTYITVPGRPRTESGYAEPLIDPNNPDESAILSGKPVVANYINFIRQFSIKLCSYDPEHPGDQTKVVWYIKWIKDLPAKAEDWTAKQIKAVEEKKRTLALMKTNLRLVIIKN